MSNEQEYEWIETEWGTFRVEKKKWGTWESFGKDGKGIVTALTKDICISGTKFHLEGVSTNWANCETSKQFDGTVGGKL